MRERISALITAASSADQHPTAHSLWFEYDTATRPADASLAGIFITLSEPISAQDSESFCHYLKSIPGIHMSCRLEHRLNRLLNRLQQDQCVTHLGWMFGRTPSHLRLVVQGESLEGLNRLAESTTGSFIPPTAVSLLSKMEQELKQMRLCLDVSEDNVSHRGLELFPRDGAERQKVLKRILRHFVNAGLGDPNMARDLLAWEGLLFPSTELPQWPALAVNQALGFTETQFSVIQKSFSHCKLVYDQSGPRQVKAYWGGEYGCLEVEQPKRRLVKAQQPLPAAASAQPTQQALGFLNAARHNSEIRAQASRRAVSDEGSLMTLAEEFGYSFDSSGLQAAFLADWQMRWSRLTRRV